MGHHRAGFDFRDGSASCQKGDDAVIMKGA